MIWFWCNEWSQEGMLRYWRVWDLLQIIGFSENPGSHHSALCRQKKPFTLFFRGKSFISLAVKSKFNNGRLRNACCMFMRSLLQHRHSKCEVSKKVFQTIIEARRSKNRKVRPRSFNRTSWQFTHPLCRIYTEYAPLHNIVNIIGEILVLASISPAQSREKSCLAPAFYQLHLQWMDGHISDIRIWSWTSHFGGERQIWLQISHLGLRVTYIATIYLFSHQDFQMLFDDTIWILTHYLIFKMFSLVDPSRLAKLGLTSPIAGNFTVIFSKCNAIHSNNAASVAYYQFTAHTLLCSCAQLVFSKV